MSIADKLTAIAEDQQRVYDAGFDAGQAQGGYGEGYEQGKIDGDVSKYASVIRFRDSTFPDGYELTVHCDQTTELPTFGGTTGLKKVVLHCRTDKRYNSVNLLYPNASVETVVFANGVKLSTASYFAVNCTSLVSMLGGIDLTDIQNDNLFVGCTNLVDVEFVPLTITHNKSFNKSYKLSDASIQSIIDGLADLTGQTTQTLTLHADVGARLTEEQKASATAKNWTLAY